MEHDPTKESNQLKPKLINGRDEMNLAEYPFGVLSKRVSENQKTIEIELEPVRNREGKLIPRKWIVTGSDKFGLPVADDERVYVSLMEETKKDNLQSRQVFFSRYQILKRIGWPNTGTYYKKIEQALDRLVGVVIKAVNVFWDNERKRYVTEAFGIIDDYKLYDESSVGKTDGQMTLPISSFRWNERLWQSLKADYIKRLDTDFWFSLKGSITRRLYRYLDKHFYWSPIYTIGLKELAFNHLGMSNKYRPAKIKSLLNPACDQLVERGYLERYDYEDRGRECQVVFVKSSQLVLPMPEEGIEPPARAQEEEDSLVAELVQRGITGTTAKRLCGKYAQERITEKIELFDYLKETDSPLVDKNPAGYLRKAIEEDYQSPEGFITKAEREENQRKREEQERLRKRREKKEEYQKWKAMSEDEKIKGHLIVWEQRFRREQGRGPTEEEKESQRQELISGLPELEKKMFGDLVEKVN